MEYLSGVPTAFKAAVEEVESNVFASCTVLLGGYGRVTKEITMPSGTATHAANDCIANVTTPSVTTHNLPLAGRKVGGTGAVIACAIKTDNPLWTTGISVIIYDGPGPAAFVADNAAFDLMYADKGNVVCQMDIVSFAKLTGGSGAAAWGRVEGINRPFQCASDSQNLYFQLYSPGVSSAQVAGQKFSLEVGIIRD
jgi:hypothetical protein